LEEKTVTDLAKFTLYSVITFSGLLIAIGTEVVTAVMIWLKIIPDTRDMPVFARISVAIGLVVSLAGVVLMTRLLLTQL
jgi:hypothetical protein